MPAKAPYTTPPAPLSPSPTAPTGGAASALPVQTSAGHFRRRFPPNPARLTAQSRPPTRSSAWTQGPRRKQPLRPPPLWRLPPFERMKSGARSSQTGPHTTGLPASSVRGLLSTESGSTALGGNGTGRALGRLCPKTLAPKANEPHQRAQSSTHKAARASATQRELLGNLTRGLEPDACNIRGPEE